MDMFEPQYASMKDPFRDELKKLDKDASWGDTIRRYRSEKIQRPKEVMVPTVDRVTVYDKSREQRQFDPILQKFRDEDKETSLRSSEHASKTWKLNRAKDTQNKQETGYNVINHQDKREGIVEQKEGVWQEMWNGQTWNAKCIKASMKASDYKSDTRVDYNILTNLAHDTHHWAPPGKRPVIVKKEEPPRQISVVCGRRDYNILTGRYIENHDDKTAIDKAMAKQEAVQKYWRTHDYDPIRVMYHDADKESEYQQMKRDLAMNQEKNMVENLPETYKKSKGNVYNITTLLVKDPEKMAQLEAMDEAEFQRLREGSKQKIEEKIKEDMFDKQDLNNRRQYNRISHKRYEQYHTNKEGYHLITNKGYQGRICKKPVDPRTKPPPTLWDKCERNAPSDAFDSSQALDLDDPKDYMTQPWARHPTPRHPLEPVSVQDNMITGPVGGAASYRNGSDGASSVRSFRSERSIRTGMSGAGRPERLSQESRLRKPDNVPSLDLTQQSGPLGAVKITPTLVDVQDAKPSGKSSKTPSVAGSRASSMRSYVS